MRMPFFFLFFSFARENMHSNVVVFLFVIHDVTSDYFHEGRNNRLSHFFFFFAKEDLFTKIEDAECFNNLFCIFSHTEL